MPCQGGCRARPGQCDRQQLRVVYDGSYHFCCCCWAMFKFTATSRYMYIQKALGWRRALFYSKVAAHDECRGSILHIFKIMTNLINKRHLYRYLSGYRCNRIGIYRYTYSIPNYIIDISIVRVISFQYIGFLCYTSYVLIEMHHLSLYMVSIRSQLYRCLKGRRLLDELLRK